MENEAAVENGAYFSVALPGTGATDFVHSRRINDVNIVVKHPSGRPWLLARMSDRVPFVHARSLRGMSVAVLGPTDADESKLETELRAVRSPRDLVGVPRIFNGSFVTMGAVNGNIYVSGPALETRRVYYVKINGVHIAADWVGVLAYLGDFPLDFTAIAMCLARGLPHPADDVPLWSGVENTSGAEYIVMESSQSWRTLETVAVLGAWSVVSTLLALYALRRVSDRTSGRSKQTVRPETSS